MSYYFRGEDKVKLIPDQMVGGYRLAERVGRGGFSEVWSSWDTHLHRLIALKLIPRTANDAHTTIQFGREAGIVTRLEHPHILPLYDFGETPEVRYLVMRYVTGGSLAQRLNHGPVAVKDALRYLTPIAETLDYIHEQRVVHRDLKPSNILLDAQDLPYITDFGLAKTLSDETQGMHTGSGTLTYMPPEQLLGRALSIRSDMFSFGVLLYEVLMGKLPYDGKVSLGMRMVSNPEAVTEIFSDDLNIPIRVNALIRLLIDPDPIVRPDNATAVMREIAELLSDTQDTGTHPITYALESGAYRQREAESLLQESIKPWQQGEFAMSLTHFVLLDILLRDLRELVTNDVQSLMLRGALEYNQQIDTWWQQSSDAERQRAVWHAVAHGDDAVRLHAVSLAISTFWPRDVGLDTINNVGKRLMPLSDFTPVGLEFLERALPIRETWENDDKLTETDSNLQALAISASPLADRAAALIGIAHRTRAMLALSKVHPVLIAYERAGSLPRSMPMRDHVRLILLLAARQLTRNPLNALDHYAWTALGSCLAVGIMIFVTFRAADPFNILSTPRLLNTLGLGLLFGMIYAVGVWVARHISQRLQVIPFWVRLILATLVGGVILALGFGLFQQLVYEDVIDPGISIVSGLLYVFGFALSVDMPSILQILLGAAGVAAAFLIPWQSYLDNNDIRPPFIFNETNPSGVLVLVICAALIFAILVQGYRWRELILKRRNTIR